MKLTLTMRIVILITMITFVTLYSVLNSNYAFAVKNDISDSNIDSDYESTINQENYQNNECRDDANCENQSLEQLNNQNNQCKDDANCVNESISNIFICEEKSLCLIQYEGPFELLNPY